jgi:hypothetical protein
MIKPTRATIPKITKTPKNDKPNSILLGSNTSAESNKYAANIIEKIKGIILKIMSINGRNGSHTGII